MTLKLLTEANKGLGQMELREIAEPELKNLTKTLGMASALYIRDENYVVCIDKIEGPSRIRIASNLGMSFHVHSTCTGKAILAYLTDSTVEKIVEAAGLPKFTENTITSMPALIKELAKIRTQGYAVDDQEFGVGIQGFAAPIFDQKGAVVAAVSASRAIVENEQRTKTIIQAVKKAAQSISTSLGYSESTITPFSG